MNAQIWAVDVSKIKESPRIMKWQEMNIGCKITLFVRVEEGFPSTAQPQYAASQLGNSLQSVAALWVARHGGDQLCRAMFEKERLVEFPDSALQNAQPNK
jgi:hypothetical protein